MSLLKDGNKSARCKVNTILLFPTSKIHLASKFRKVLSTHRKIDDLKPF